MNRARSGFTLLEAVIALAILGVASISALQAVGAELRANERAVRALEAEALATYRMSTIELLYAEEMFSFPDSLARGTFRAPNDRYRWTTEVQQLLGEENVWEVGVKVEWPGGSYSLQTLLYRRLAELGGATP